MPRSSMLKIPVRTAGPFAPPFASLLTRSTKRDWTWADLIRAAWTVGRSRADVAGITFTRLDELEVLSRAYALHAYLRETRGGRLTRTKLYDRLDRSEKVGVSYLLGMMGAKLVAERHLGAAWLMHVDRFAEKNDVAFGEEWNGKRWVKRRPDLLGLTLGSEWIVVEAKGRSGLREAGLLEHAKNQTTFVKAVNGKPPLGGFAVATSFESSGLAIAVRDPPPREEGAVEWQVDPAEYLQTYYRPIVSPILSEPSGRVLHENRAYLVRTYPEFDLRVGFAPEVLRADRFPSSPWLTDFIRRTAGVEVTTSEFAEDQGEASFGDDGVIVLTGPMWSRDRMKLEPVKRNPTGDS